MGRKKRVKHMYVPILIEFFNLVCQVILGFNIFKSVHFCFKVLFVGESYKSILTLCLMMIKTLAHVALIWSWPRCRIFLTLWVRRRKLAIRLGRWWCHTLGLCPTGLPARGTTTIIYYVSRGIFHETLLRRMEFHVILYLICYLNSIIYRRIIMIA